MKNILILLFFPCLLFSQILDEYPKDQFFYKGGIVNFYKEAHELLIKSDAKECDPKEIYVQRILVTPEGKVKLVKDTDSANISKNKCAYNVSLSILKGLKKWNPAEVKGGTFGAIADFIVYPKDIMSNYKENYNPNNFVINALYPDGMKKFQKEFHDNFMSLFHDYNINGNINLEFFISESGEITNARIYPEIDNKVFNVDFFRTLKRLHKKWQPALYSNIPIKQRISYPLNFSVHFNSNNSNNNY